MTVLECYFSTSAHYVRFATSTYPVEEGSNVDVTLAMSLPYSTSTVDVPIVVAGGSAGSGDFSLTRVGANTTGTTATFAASSTTTSFKVYTTGDQTAEDDETVILRLGTFSTTTMPMGVFPSYGMGTTTVTIVDDDPPDRRPSFGSATVRDRTYNTGSSVSLTLPAATGGGWNTQLLHQRTSAGTELHEHDPAHYRLAHQRGFLRCHLYRYRRRRRHRPD